MSEKTMTRSIGGRGKRRKTTKVQGKAVKMVVVDLIDQSVIF
jgi:hypothetical protein